VRLPQLASNNVAYSTDVFHSTDESADARVQAIIAANDSAANPGKGVERRGGERKVASTVAASSDDRLASAR
jgi:hypothetical protein